MMWTSRKLFIGLLMLTSCVVSSQSIFGEWKTIDDRTGKPKAVISIYEKNGLMYGHIVKILEIGKENALCSKCDGEMKNEPILGMTVIDGAEYHGKGIYRGDTLFDPEQAMTFRCKIWLNPDNSDELHVRGYLAFIYRTQTWIRVQG